MANIVITSTIKYLEIDFGVLQSKYKAKMISLKKSQIAEISQSTNETVFVVVIHSSGIKKFYKLSHNGVNGDLVDSVGGNSVASTDDLYNKLNALIKNGPENTKVQRVGDINYIAFAAPGTAWATAEWKCMRIDETINGSLEIDKTWADNGNYSQVATDLTILEYS